MAISNEYYPQEVSHPASTLGEKLDEMSMSRKEFALRTGKPEKTIIAVLKGESSITSEMAILFENITKIPAHFWLNRQAQYNEYKARLKRVSAITEASEWSGSFPYQEMVRLGWVSPARTREDKSMRLFEFFAIATHDAWQKIYMESRLKVAAYISLKHLHNPYTISAWLRKGELQAAEINAPEYNRKAFAKSMNEIKTLSALHPENYFSELQRICLKAGVVVIYTPKLTGAPISGSTRWIRNNPVIQLTARYKQNDRFWFTYFHEAGHVLLHGKKYVSLEGVDFHESDPLKEEEANKFAEKWLLTEEEEREIVALGIPDKQAIVKFSEKFNTHPAIIIGRLQHRGKLPYSFGRELFLTIELA